MSMLVSHLLVQTILSIYVVQTITRKWDIKFTNYMSSLDYLLYFGYPLGTPTPSPVGSVQSCRPFHWLSEVDLFSVIPCVI